MTSTYTERFKIFTGKTSPGYAPYPFQAELAERPWPELLAIPTGLGKTQAVIGAWLHKRLIGDEETGCRLVYCLPMRVLVEQTEQVAKEMCNAAEALFAEAGRAAPTVHVLMGGDLDESWQGDPSGEAILIGTQDMLLSRALNRGYAMSRYRWPMHFGLLNNDAMWVYDETQLLGVGLETSAQLEGLRRAHGTLGKTRSLWMSATLTADHLSTVDHRAPTDGFSTLGLADADKDSTEVQKRIAAHKALAHVPSLALSADIKTPAYVEALAEHIVKRHAQAGDLTLVVLNQVKRAQDLYAALKKKLGDEASIGLIHSRFRGADRKERETILEAKGTRIVVATQVVEAGVDISAKTLLTELCPWSSLIQRFGRCNRHGEYGQGEASIEWIDASLDDKKTEKLLLPYTPNELALAKENLLLLAEHGIGAGPNALGALSDQSERPVHPVLRRRDLLALFDTSSDLSGEDLDVSRFIRDAGTPDVFFYWRDFTDAQLGIEKDAAKKVRRDAPRREELCRVGIGPAKEFLDDLQKRAKAAWEKSRGNPKHSDEARRLKAMTWDGLSGAWVEVQSRNLRPGVVLALDPLAGGYSEEIGWKGKDKKPTPVPPVPPPDKATIGNNHSSDDEHGESLKSSDVGKWVLLENHLAHVRDEARIFAMQTGLSGEYQALLATAGLWHDVGKAHEEFQGRLLDPLGDDKPPEKKGSGLWAKSNHQRRSKREPHRRYFRHELASMLAYLQASDEEDERTRDLTAYLVLAHHGKVRVSLRSLPNEKPPGATENLIAHGVVDGDEISSVMLPDVGELSAVTLDLSLMQLGEGSWLERVLRLRDAKDLGPFRLAFLETVLRAADWKASNKEQAEGYGDD